MSEISAGSTDARMDVTVAVTADVTIKPRGRPSDDELAGLELPHRSLPEGNGWYAHFLIHPGGAPSCKRMTQGDHDDRWFRALAG